MDTIKLWARNGDAVRRAIALGELVHLDTASEELSVSCASSRVHPNALTRGDAVTQSPHPTTMG
jgi:hypothetical protein